MFNLRRVAPFAFAFLLCFMAAFAQDATGKIVGNVTDPTGAAVQGAKVTVTNLETNIEHSTTSDNTGYYQVLQLPIGRYRVVVSASGFQQTTIQAQTPLEINSTLRVDARLEVGKLSDTITVESTSSLVETSIATVGATVTGEAIYEMPLNGRNTLDLLKTLPGVTATNPDSGASGNYSIGGQRTDSITFLLDGGNNTDLLSNNVVANPNPDAVAEFRVLESNYNAEYGRNAGGIVSVVTKSGSNQFHGTAFDYIRNNDFNANSFFNNEQGLPVPILKRNQFGGTVGGPIRKNKLFFFFSYEGQRQIALDNSNGKVNTYTPAEANGDFSQSGGQSLVAAFLQKNPQYQANPTLAAQGIIDPNKIDPVAKTYFAKGLIPTSPSGFIFPSAGANANFDEYLGKLDYNITDRDILTATFYSQDYPKLRPFGGGTGIPFTNVSGYPVTYEDTTSFGSVAYTHTFSPTIVNEARFTAQRLNHLQAIPAATLPKASDLGINVTSDQPTGPPIIGLLGSNTAIGFSPQGPTREVDNTYAFFDNVSWTKGKHNMKFGFYFSPYQNNTVYDFYVNGEFFFYGPFTGVGSGVDLADFLLGLPDEYFQFGKAPSNIRSHQYSTFAQDEWHVRKNLTLTFGIRYEYAQPKFDTQGRSFAFIPGLQSERFPNAPPGLVFPGDPGAPKGSNFPDKNDWAPRFGFAWDIFGDGKTSLRGGVGIFYDILKGEDNLQYNGQAPFFGFADIFPNAQAGPSGLQDPFAAAGAVNPFPSKPPAKNIDFNAAGFLPFGGGGVYFVDPHLRTPYVYQYNLSIQRELGSGTTVEVGYIGYSAHKLTSLVDVNPFVLGTNTRLYGSNFSYLDEFQNVSGANYNALQASVRRQFKSMGKFGSSFFQFGYTLGHELDNVSGFRERNSNVPYYNHRQFYASGDTDVRNAVTISGGWDLPFDQLWERGPKLLTRGWSLYPIFTARSGFPLDILSGLQTTRSDPGPSGAGDAFWVRADLVGSNIPTFDPHQYQNLNNPSAGGSNPGNYWFNPANFSISRLLALDTIAMTDASKLPGFTYGTAPRNAFRGPDEVNLDLAIAKHFKIAERFELELRGDFFNILNHAQFANPDTTITDPTFGQISNTIKDSSSFGLSSGRIIQIAAHLRF
jgi:hypothetical protein